VVIAVNAVLLLKPSVLELADTTPPSDAVQALVTTTALQVSGVHATGWCNVRKMGFEYVVDLQVFVDGDTTVRHGHQLGHEIEHAVRQANPRITLVLVHLEPHQHG
jgi:divalent metal cation (Fe/Co/Zn/Cd) transporter